MDKHLRSGTIGGNFGFEAAPFPETSKPPVDLKCSIQTVNGRSGMHMLLLKLSPRQVWMPSYLCSAMLKAIQNTGAMLKFYEVDSRLEICRDDWTEDIEPYDVVVFVDYFGFRTCMDFAGEVRGRGAWVLEDASQALLTEGVGDGADVVVYSPRKFLAIPDGGLLVSVNKGIDLGDMELKKAPAEWWLKSLSAMILRREIGSHDQVRRRQALKDEVSVGQPVGPYAMSETTKMMLEHAFDYRTIAGKRRENYELLSAELRDYALYPDLGRGVVPLGFPVVLEDRDQAYSLLMEKDIEPAIHWRLSRIVSAKYEGSHRLSTRILTLPCDQRYKAEDMERVIDSLQRILDN